MRTDSTDSSTMLTGDPFSDCFTIDTTDQVHHSTAFNKPTIEVPILDPLPHLTPWSPQSSLSTPSTTSSSTEASFDDPITWSNADLLYLLTCLHSTLLLSSHLIFTPPLASLHDTPTPIHLRLYKTLPHTPIPRAAYSKHLPIGTGRPITKLLIAESSPACTSARDARTSLATNLLANQNHAAYMLDKYNVLNALHASTTTTLRALQRGMIEMLGVSAAEWVERLDQLGGWVDGECGLEARMEVFLLGVGRAETEEWVGVVEGAMGMDGDGVGWRWGWMAMGLDGDGVGWRGEGDVGGCVWGCGGVVGEGL
ncbi:hypothetical protein FB567DRAFT_627156 [Paraphoma chrysanthemicola]|uniref:Uncharacterized protein n=1 Tax=Paraphoma chrysanthemicola TaxID=798071 RepID=A0A8K0RCW0_9PLEO|nr:hypothetical protein FB567DRAFT_627156 [Paraphoma chrysanthemicola]